MPCLSDYPAPTHSEIHNLEKESSNLHRQMNNLQAALCVSLTFIESLDDNKLTELCLSTDWKEAGITEKAFLSWWINHKAADIKRREREKREATAKERKQEAEKLRKAKRAIALSKLTDEDLKALGIK